MAGLFEELSDVADALVDYFMSDSEQSVYVYLFHFQVLVQDNG